MVSLLCAIRSWSVLSGQLSRTHYVSRIVIWPYLMAVVARRRGQGKSEQPTVVCLYLSGPYCMYTILRSSLHVLLEAPPIRQAFSALHSVLDPEAVRGGSYVAAISTSLDGAGVPSDTPASNSNTRFAFRPDLSMPQ